MKNTFTQKRSCYLVIKQNAHDIKFHGAFSSEEKARKGVTRLAKHYKCKPEDYQIVLFILNDFEEHLVLHPYTINF